MNRSLVRTLIYVLVAAQVLLSAPVVASMSASQTSTMDCGDSMPHPGDGSDPCPCCPEDTGSAACLSSCTASAGAIPDLDISVPRVDFDPPSPPVVIPLALAADPPLKPPPID